MALKRKNPPAKWVLPDAVHPPDSICFKIPVPNNPYYLAAFRGALLNLASARQWGDDPSHTALEVAAVWKAIYDQVVATACDNPPTTIDRLQVEFDTMASIFDVYCDDQGNCHAEFRCSLCDPYIELATKADLISNPPGTNIQPKPGGGTSNYCNKVSAVDGIVIPIPVSTGDLLEVVSAMGNWGDGGLTSYCIDGNIFYIDCTSAGAAPLAGDFVTGAPHMSMIVRFSTGYYALYPGASLVIPAGVTAEQPFVLANKATLNSGSGAIDTCFKVTNNSVAHWSHTFDFTVSPGGWLGQAISDPAIPIWTPGVGWVGQQGISSPLDNFNAIKRDFAATALTEIRFIYSTGANTGGFYGAGIIHGSTTGLTLVGTPGSHDLSFAIPYPGCTHIDVVLDETTGAASPSIISEIIISGTGTDPF